MYVTKAEIIEEIININYYLMEAIRKEERQNVLKNKILLDNLIKIYLNNDERAD